MVPAPTQRSSPPPPALNNYIYQPPRRRAADIRQHISEPPALSTPHPFSVLIPTTLPLKIPHWQTVRYSVYPATFPSVHETDQSRISIDLVNLSVRIHLFYGTAANTPEEGEQGGGYAAPSVSAGMTTPLQTISSSAGLTRRKVIPSGDDIHTRKTPPEASNPMPTRRPRRLPVPGPQVRRSQTLFLTPHHPRVCARRLESKVAASSSTSAPRSLSSRARAQRAREDGGPAARALNAGVCAEALALKAEVLAGCRRAPLRTCCGAQSAASAVSAYGAGNGWAAARGVGGGGGEGDAWGRCARSSRARWAAGRAGQWTAGACVFFLLFLSLCPPALMHLTESEETQGMIPPAVVQVFCVADELTQRQRLHDGGPGPRDLQEPITDVSGRNEPPRTHEIHHRPAPRCTTAWDLQRPRSPAPRRPCARCSRRRRRRGDAHERAHSVFTLHICEPHARVGALHRVDLAGSAPPRGVRRVKDTQRINRNPSVRALGDVVAALGSGPARMSRCPVGWCKELDLDGALYQ
ncbi:hypothetical protein FB451DRAFT_1557517 [Mycena latifolia]|nr:hypothetical protein FB451DRAFT_1557517 [Mycena latifolia]